MKELLHFLVWFAKKVDPFYFLCILSVSVTITGFMIQSINTVTTGIMIMVSVLLKIFVYDTIINNWKIFKEEKNSLLTKIKNSN